MATSKLKPTRKQANREKLASAAACLFLEKGFDRTTVEEIAEIAGVSRRTFFRHFPTKEAVVFPGHEQRIAQFRSLLSKHLNTSTPFRAVRKSLLDFAEGYYRDRDSLLKQYRIVQASPYLIARELEFDAEYEQAIANALIPDGDPSHLVRRQAKILAGAVFGAIRAVLKDWFEGECNEDLAQLGEISLSMLESGALTLTFGAEILSGEQTKK